MGEGGTDAGWVHRRRADPAFLSLSGVRSGPNRRLCVQPASMRPGGVCALGERNQAGGRVFLFLGTDDFWSDYERIRKNGVEFIRPPKEMDYGTVAVFKDLYGNLWDLVEFSPNHPMRERVR